MEGGLVLFGIIRLKEPQYEHNALVKVSSLYLKRLKRKAITSFSYTGAITLFLGVV